VNVTTASTLVSLVLLFPLLGAALNGLLGPVLGRRFVNMAGTVSIFAAFVISCLVLANVVGAPAGHGSITVRLWDWIDLGGGTNLTVGMDFTLDALSALMLMVITGVGFLIHVYSVGYMEHDPGFARFFSYMNFFIFSMLTLVACGGPRHPDHRVGAGGVEQLPAHRLLVRPADRRPGCSQSVHDAR